jgi:hypothetical protein
MQVINAQAAAGWWHSFPHNDVAVRQVEGLKVIMRQVRAVALGC